MDSTANNKYETLIKTSIKESLSYGSKSFWEVVRQCKGAYPTLVKKCLEELNLEITGNSQNYYNLSKRKKVLP
ncbi:MAG TPA: hypothetical protein VGB02_13270 [Pyrinomonadaceae bacterium]|jgi:predicted ATPase